LLLFTATLALYSWTHWSSLVTTLFVFLYGLEANFLINAMHELGHGAVFKTPLFNTIFLRILSFLGWLHPDMFFSSHLLHHRYTLWFPEYDQENPLPIKFTILDFFIAGFVNIPGCYDTIKTAVLEALPTYPTNHLGWTLVWEKTCYPPEKPELRRPATMWARVLVLGHLAITIISLIKGYWLVPIIFCLGPFYGGFLFFLCNNTQHVGLRPNCNDFRMNCRTFLLHPWIRFLYWNMNYHVEHHMYAGVPCYNLPALHDAIKHDLPTTPDGIYQVWSVIAEVLRNQDADSSYYQDISLPQNKKD